MVNMGKIGYVKRMISALLGLIAESSIPATESKLLSLQLLLEFSSSVFMSPSV